MKSDRFDYWRISPVIFSTLCSLAFVFYKVAISLNSQWDTTLPEGSIVFSISQLLHGHGLYRDYSLPPYATTPYTPLYYLIIALLGRSLDSSVASIYILGRSITLMSVFACSYFTYKLSQHAGATRSSSILAGTFSLSLPIIITWGVTCRPDFVAAALTLAAINCYTSNEKPTRVIWTSLLFVAAFMTKQSFVTGILSLTLMMIADRKRKELLILWGVFLSATLAAYGTAQWLTDGLFYTNIFTANITHYNTEGLYKLFLKAYLLNGTIVIPCALLGVFWVRNNNTKFFEIFASTSLLFFTLSLLKAGSSENYFIEPLIAASIISSRGLDLANTLGRRRIWISGAFFMVNLLLASVRMHDLWEKAREAVPNISPQQVFESTQPAAGKVLYIDSTLSLRSGGPVDLLDEFNASYLETEGKLNLSPLMQKIERHNFALIVTRYLHWDAYQSYWLIPESIGQAIGRNYQLSRIMGPVNIYTPKVPTSPPYESTLLSRNYPSTVTLEVENMPIREMDIIGGMRNGAILSSNGYIGQHVPFKQSGIYRFDLRAFSTIVDGVGWAKAEIRIDDIAISRFDIDSEYWKTFSFQAHIESGTHKVSIAFLNDFYIPSININTRREDLNLFADKISIYLVTPDALSRTE